MFTGNSRRRVERALQVAAALLAIGLTLGLYIGGAQPVAVGLIPPPWDKLTHLAVFAILAASIGLGSGLRGRGVLALAFLGALAVGLLDEWHQLSLPGRSAGWDDLAFDALGAALGAAALLWRTRVEAWLFSQR